MVPAAIVIADDMEKGGSDSDSLPSSPTHHHEVLYRRPWIHEPRATNFFVRLITSLYALILTIISLVVEVSPTWRTDMWKAETFFYIAMYGVGILFFAYCYVFIIYPGPYNYLISVLRRYKIIKNAQEAKAHKKAKLKQTFRKYYSSSSSSSSEEVHELINAVLNATINNTPEGTTAEPTSVSRLFALEQFGDVATFLTTCIVEYSLIGAAIMFILWKSIGQNSHHQSNSVGIDVFITCRRSADLSVSALPAFVFAIRMIQVVVQAAFILTTSRLRCLSKYSIKHKPGKEIITFLLVSNVTLFVFHTFEGMKSSFGFSSKAATQYNYIIYAVAPLLVFYRFHSSACLAEIWKHTYSTKSGEYDHDQTMSLSDSNLTAMTPISDGKHDEVPPSPTETLKH
ncbi:unnamed protein product [Caenorhabditis sp. 36 PRJEB53466]|nr:unnamed protein product [Caenorhabditis sp. 36 PRJEB53466]